MCENNICCYIFSVIGILIVGGSVLCYIIGEIVLDIKALTNKDEIYEDITGTKYYYHCKIELAMIVTVFSLFLLATSLIFMPCSILWPYLILFQLPFTFIGITGAIYTIFIFKDMTDSRCQDDRVNATYYVSHVDIGSYTGRMIQKHFPNATEFSEIYSGVEKWVDKTCNKDYTKRAYVVGIGGIGFVWFLTSPTLFLIFYCWIRLKCRCRC